MSSAVLQTVDGVVRGGAWVVAGGLALEQIGELVVDLWARMRGLDHRGARSLSLETLARAQRKRVAILIPQADPELLAHNLAALEHERDRFIVFCTGVASRPGVQAVSAPDGPRGAVLAALLEAVIAEEARSGAFHLVLVQGPEDIIHPLSLALASLLCPTHHLVQLPTVALRDRRPGRPVLRRLVQQDLGGFRPAGTGLILCRHTLGAVKFDGHSDAPDGGVGARFVAAGKRVRFACHGVTASDGREDLIANRQLRPGNERRLARALCLLAAAFIGHGVIRDAGLPLALLGALLGITLLAEPWPGAGRRDQLLRALARRRGALLRPRGLPASEVQAALSLQRSLDRPDSEVLAICQPSPARQPLSQRRAHSRRRGSPRGRAPRHANSPHARDLSQ